ncbi:MAG TPA: hypothetical protein VGM88_13305 [Kofleriaceae bacterium]|jgi:hypothetical protein
MRLSLLLLVISLAACGDKTIKCVESLDDYCTQHPTVCQATTYQDFINVNCPAPASTGVFVGVCHGYKIVRLESAQVFIAMFDQDTDQLVAFSQLSVIDEDFACEGGPDSVTDPDCDLTDLKLTCGQNPDI